MTPRAGAGKRRPALTAHLGFLCLCGAWAALGCQAAWACSDRDPALVQAQDNFAQRQEMAQAERAADLFRLALDRDHHCWAAALGLARASVYIGALSSGEREQRAYGEAAQAARLLAEGRPHRVEGHYWLGVAQALKANAGGLVSAVPRVRQAKASLAKALELDPTYDQGGPHRVLGRLYFKLPAMLGGDNHLAERHLRRALELGPRHWLTHIYLAVLLRAQGRRAEADDLLRQAIAGPAEPGHEAEFPIWSQRARQLLQEP